MMCRQRPARLPPHPTSSRRLLSATLATPSSCSRCFVQQRLHVNAQKLAEARGVINVFHIPGAAVALPSPERISEIHH
jgi:hypothetical protein